MAQPPRPRVAEDAHATWSPVLHVDAAAGRLWLFYTQVTSELRLRMHKRTTYSSLPLRVRVRVRVRIKDT